MKKKSTIPDSEFADFESAVSDVTPYHHGKVQLTTKSKKAISPEKKADLRCEKQPLSEPPPKLQAESPMTYKRPEIPHKTLRHLKKGQYNIDAKLDLHGMTVRDAEAVLTLFLDECLAHGDRVVLIVHGKSRHQETPIIKNRLNHWLREYNDVLAFCSASVHHGSRGAVYVLLKNSIS